MDECFAFFDAWTTARDYLAVFGSLASTRLRNDAARAACDLVGLRAMPTPAGSALDLAIAERQLARLTRARRLLRLLFDGCSAQVAGNVAGVDALADRAAALMEQDRADLAALASKTE